MATYDSQYETIKKDFDSRDKSVKQLAGPIPLNRETKPYNPTVLALVSFMLQYNEKTGGKYSTSYVKNNKITSIEKTDLKLFEPYVKYLMKGEKNPDAKSLYEAEIILYILLIKELLIP